MARQSDMEPIQIRRIIEAALLAATQPLPLSQLLTLYSDADQVDADAIGRAVEELRAESATRGIELVEVASGLRFQVAADVHPYVARLWTERQTRYSRALLETLALIAYRQPITRGEIEQIRGVTVAASIMRTLEEREWIRVVGHRDVPGRPALFGTTRQFLDYFNLKSLDGLPPLAAIRDLSEIEPQLQLPVAGDGTPHAPILEHDPAIATASDADDLTAATGTDDAPIAHVGTDDLPAGANESEGLVVDDAIHPTAPDGNRAPEPST